MVHTPGAITLWLMTDPVPIYLKYLNYINLIWTI